MLNTYVGGTGMTINIDQYEFSSKFDGGNMLTAVKESCPLGGAPIYKVYVAEDCYDSLSQNHFRMWYYFSIKGGNAGEVIRIRIMNLNRVSIVYNQDIHPSVMSKPSNPVWTRHNGTVRYLLSDKDLKLYFEYRFICSSDIVYFSFVKPYSHKQFQDMLLQFDNKYLTNDINDVLYPHESYIYSGSKQNADIHNATDPLCLSKQIYYHREVITLSLDYLPIELLTITSRNGILKNHEIPHDGLFNKNPRPLLVKGKRCIFIGARVHPGEAPASQMMESILNFLLDEHDAQAALLRDKFVFKVAPMLNPDGVRRGYYRSNTLGINLNRAWENPTLINAPSIFAAKSIIGNLSSLYESERGRRDGVFMCIDIHAYACRPGYYFLGNSMPDHQLVECITFAKILAQLSAHFNFEACNFPSLKKRKGSKKESNSGDLKALESCGGLSLDTLVHELRLWGVTKEKETSGFKSSKSGTGRVALFKQFGIIHSYTIECSCNPVVDAAHVNYEKAIEESRKSVSTKIDSDMLGKKTHTIA